MSKKRRCQVDILVDYHRQFSAIQRHCRKNGRPVPSMPYLVNRAVEIGAQKVIDEFMPAKVQDVT